MGTLVLLAFTIIVAASYYLWDEFQHRKVMLDTLSQAHWDDKALVEQLNENLKEEYPALYRVVRSLLKSNIRFDSKEILNTVRPIKGSGKDSINFEIKKIMQEDNQENKQVVVWYLVSCIQINSVNNRKIENVNILNDETQKLKQGRLEEFENKEMFCFS